MKKLETLLMKVEYNAFIKEKKKLAYNSNILICYSLGLDYVVFLNLDVKKFGPK